MRRAAPAVLAAFVLAMVFGASAIAHTWTDIYTYGSNARWSEANDHQILLYNEPTVTGGFLGRIQSGAKSWEGYPDADDFNFLYAGEGVYAHWCGGSTTNRNPIYQQTWDGPHGVLAATQACVYSPDPSKLFRYIMWFDSQEPWYTGTGTPGANQYDLWSVAAHEFGHAAGWEAHFSSYGSRCPNSNWHHTMCVTNIIGTTWDRDLNTHDIHTFVAAY